MSPLASVVDLDALWKIVLIALGGGVGVTAIFGFGVLRLETLDQARADGRTATALVAGATVALCAVVCLAAVVFGVLAMTHK